MIVLEYLKYPSGSEHGTLNTGIKVRIPLQTWMYEIFCYSVLAGFVVFSFSIQSCTPCLYKDLDNLYIRGSQG